MTPADPRSSAPPDERTRCEKCWGKGFIGGNPYPCDNCFGMGTIASALPSSGAPAPTGLPHKDSCASRYANSDGERFACNCGAPAPAETGQEQEQNRQEKTENVQPQVQVPSRSASRELDALIAEKVMGWHRVVDWGYRPPQIEWHSVTDGCGRFESFVNSPDQMPEMQNITFRPSTAIADAWLVVERMHALGYEVCLYDERPTAHHGWGWEATAGNDDDDHTSMLCDTAPLAICRAALAAVGAQNSDAGSVVLAVDKCSDAQRSGMPSRSTPQTDDAT